MIESVREKVEVEGSAEELFERLSELENFCDFVRSAEEASRASLLLSRWLLKDPLGRSAEFGPGSFRRCSAFAEDPATSPERWDAARLAVDRGELDFERLSSDRTLLFVTAHFSIPPGDDDEGETFIATLSELVREHLSRADVDRASEGNPKPAADPLLALLREWESDESGYDEETLPSLKEALDRDRTSYRKLFGRG